MQYKAILVSLFAVAAMAAPTTQPESKAIKAVTSHGDNHIVPVGSDNLNGNGKGNGDGNKIVKGFNSNDVANDVASENFKGNGHNAVGNGNGHNAVGTGNDIDIIDHLH